MIDGMFFSLLSPLKSLSLSLSLYLSLSLLFPLMQRGWTTWTTGAVDKRVIGIIPIVMDLLNMAKVSLCCACVD